MSSQTRWIQTNTLICLFAGLSSKYKTPIIIKWNYPLTAFWNLACLSRAMKSFNWNTVITAAIGTSIKPQSVWNIRLVVPLDTVNCPSPASNGTASCVSSFMLSTAQRHTHNQESAVWCAVEQRGEPSTPRSEQRRESTLSALPLIGALTNPLPHHSLCASHRPSKWPSDALNLGLASISHILLLPVLRRWHREWCVCKDANECVCVLFLSKRRLWKEMKPIIELKLYHFEWVILILKCSTQDTILVWASQSKISICLAHESEWSTAHNRNIPGLIPTGDLWYNKQKLNVICSHFTISIFNSFVWDSGHKRLISLRFVQLDFVQNVWFMMLILTQIDESFWQICCMSLGKDVFIRVEKGGEIFYRGTAYSSY